jgi:hypothetical protein
MSYRDAAFDEALKDQLVARHDEASARIERLERELAEARGWLKNRAALPSRASRGARVAAWGGYGSLAGALIGTGLWLGLGTPVLIPLATMVGALAGALIRLGDVNADDRFPPPSNDHANLRY